MQGSRKGKCAAPRLPPHPPTPPKRSLARRDFQPAGSQHSGEPQGRPRQSRRRTQPPGAAKRTLHPGSRYISICPEGNGGGLSLGAFPKDTTSRMFRKCENFNPFPSGSPQRAPTCAARFSLDFHTELRIQSSFCCAPNSCPDRCVQRS